MKKTFRTLLSFFLVAMIAVSSMNGIAADNTPQEPKTVNVRFTIPTSIAKKKTNYTFSIREKGKQDWTFHGLYETSEGLQINLNVSENTDYEYVLNYFDNRTYYKVIGDTLSVDGETAITNTTRENGLVSSELVKNENESYWNLKQESHPVTNKFEANSMVMLSVDPENATPYLNVYDYDGSLVPLERGYRYTFYKPSYKNMPDGVDFRYEINAPGYELATGAIHYNQGNDGTGTFIDTVGHEAVFSGPFATFTLKRSNVSVDVIVPNLLNDTEVATSSLKDTTTVKFEQDRFNIDLGGQTEDTVTMTFVLENYVPVTMVVNVKSDGTVTVINENELSNAVKNLNIVDNTISFNQLRQGPITENPDGSGVVAFGNLKDYFGSTGSVIPGQINSHQFRITNPSNNRYRIIGAELFANNDAVFANGMYRTESKIIKSYYEHFNPTYELKEGSAAYLFDFEAINGISLYDGILKEYQRTMPKLERLEDLPADELLNIFTMNFEFDSSVWEGNPNADYAVQVSPGQFAIREQDPKMLALGQHHLFNNALYLSFDQSLYPLSSVASGMASSLQFNEYLEGTPENREMTQAIFKNIGVIESGTYVDFDNFGYVLDGNMVPNAYKPTFNSFDFGFNLQLGIVGIDGYAFHDSDRDGYQDENETVMAGVELELLSNGVVVASSQTSDSGYYAFPNVDSGNYQIRVKIPENFNITSKVNALLGNRFDASGLSDTVTVVDNENYHYRVGFVSPLPVVNGTVEAKHVLVDETGTIVETLDVETITGKVGSAYSLSPKTYDAYEFVRHEGAPANGSFTVDSQNMAFIYRKKAATLIVNYVDVNGKTIAPTTTLTHKINDTYTVSILDIDGYTFKSIQEGSAPLSGKLGAGDTVVTLVYAQNTGPVIPDAVVLEVNYRDEKGHVIAPQVQTTHDLNSPYVVTPIAIKGYTFKRIDVTSEPLEGTLTKPKTVVTLIYKKNESDKELPNTGVSQSHLGFILVGAGLVIIGMKRRKRETV